MPPTPRRRFTILDAMFFVAATAIGLAAIRGAVPRVLQILPTGLRVLFRIPRPVLDASLIVLTAWPLAAMWTLALLAMRLHGTRPGWRRLARRPGVVACCVAVLASLFNVLMLASMALKVGSIPRDFIPFAAFLIGFAVASSWATLLLGGRWRPEPCPFDRAGRALGVYWVAMVPLSLALFLCLLR